MFKQKLKRSFKKLSAALLSASLIISNMAGFYAGIDKNEVNAYAANYGLVSNVQDAAILHCWNWSYSTIEQHLELIAECGYSAIQTSPATQPKDYKWEGEVGMEVGFPGVAGSGNWWKVYQPVTVSVCDNGETWFGTKAELQSLCKKAEEYGIKVIVDVVANHLGNITGWQNSLKDVSPQVGEFWNPDMMTDESFWHINNIMVHHSDGRRDITQGCMGMPDLNTGDSRVQKYYKDYLIELIDCGVDGFRFDAAKHIETPDDDPTYASDFWPNVLNPAESHYKSKTGGDLYVYGEILNTVGDGFSINAYTKYMSVTDNSAGNHCLASFRNNQIGNISMHHPVDKSVLWAESHDTYMNEASRYGSDRSIVRTWSFVANKNGSAALYFVRPYYSTDTLINDVDGNFREDIKTTVEPALMGECSTYIWATKEVAAINHFKNRMVGQAEYYGSSGNVGYCRRGNGVILVNMSGAGSVSVNVGGLSNGTYKDEVSGNTFTVSGGTVSGTIGSEYGIAVIYQNTMPNPNPNRPVQISASVSNGSIYYTNGLNVTVNAKNATSASYVASTGESGSFTESKDITIGKGLLDGQTLTLTITATNSYGTVKKVFTYTKDSKTVEIVADKEDGSKFYTDGFDLTIEAISADSATYSASTGEKGSFTGSTTVTIGEGLSNGETVTITVTGTNAKGTVTETFTYTKSDSPLGTAVLFKNTSSWSKVNAYAWNSSSDKMSEWPGTEMKVFDAAENIYIIEFKTANAYKNIIFNNGSSQTKDLTIPGMGYIYDYSTGSWKEYEEPVKPVKPTVNATLASGEVTGATSVTYTVKDATSATYSLNGGNKVSFSDSVTLTVGNNETDTVVITATNGTGTTTKTYTYTCKKQEEPLSGTLKINGSTSAITKNVGTSVTFNASATGGSGSYTYKFAVLNVDNGKLSVLQDFSNSSTYTFALNYAGVKQFVVTVKDSNGNTVETNKINVTVVDPVKPLAGTLTIDGSTSAITKNVGSSVTLKANAAGGSGAYSYKFAVLNVDNGKWTVLQNFASASSYTFALNYAGVKEFALTIKDSNGTTVAANRIKVTVVKPVEPLAGTLTIGGSSANLTKELGSSVTLKANATGGSGTYSYKFAVLNVDNGKWSILQDFKANSTYTFALNYTGTKQFAVTVKDSNGTTVGTNRITVKVVKQSEELKGSLTVNGSTAALTKTKGSSVTLKASATGGSGSYTYKFAVFNVATGKWTVLQDFKANSTYTFALNYTGTKQFALTIKDSAGTTVATNRITVNVTEGQSELSAKLTVNGATGTIVGFVGDSVTLSATATGGSGSYTYKFVVYNVNTNSWFVLKQYNTTSSYTTKLSSAGTKQFVVSVQDSARTVFTTERVTVNVFS